MKPQTAVSLQTICIDFQQSRPERMAKTKQAPERRAAAQQCSHADIMDADNILYLQLI